MCYLVFAWFPSNFSYTPVNKFIAPWDKFIVLKICLLKFSYDEQNTQATVNLLVIDWNLSKNIIF